MPSGKKWQSGLLQLRHEAISGGRTLGYAHMVTDPLAQPWATFTMWLPEGGMSNAYTWSDIWHLHVDCMTRRLDVLIDLREEQGEVVVEHSAPLTPHDVDELVDGATAADAAFETMCRLVQPPLAVEVATDDTIRWLVENSRPSSALSERIRDMPLWTPTRGPSLPIDQ